MRRPLLTLAAPAVACALLPATADAQSAFKPCGRSVSCASINVPLDRTGGLPGTVTLRAERIRLARRTNGVVVALSGGPGEPAIPFAEDFATILRPALRSRDLVLFDQRGTGGSGALRCRTLERARPAAYTTAAEQCAATLGPRRAFYTTRDTVEDIEAVRQALGVDKLTIFGVSYGTKVALAYALAHPEHVDRLVLDSVLEPEQPDPLYRDTFKAAGRALVELCRGRCGPITPNVVADLQVLVQRLAAGPITGSVNGDNGKRVAARMSHFELLAILVAGDVDPTIRAGVPGAVRAAVRGDTAPILRLARRAVAEEGTPPPAEEFSAGLFAATICEETALPWDRTAPFEERPAQAQARVDALDPAEFAPLDSRTALASDLIRLCARWPANPSPPSLSAGPFPAVPTLILEGGDDLRTPLEGAQRLAARLPAGARIVAVPGVGHSVLGVDESGCAERALAAFFANRPIANCGPRRREFPPDPLPPLSPRELKPAKGARGARGLTITSVGRTLYDVVTEAANDVLSNPVGSELRGAGLRSGYFRAVRRGYVLRNVVYVPGVRVSGFLNDRSFAATLTVRGSAAVDGRLKLRRGRISGVLGGRRVRAVLRPQDAGISRRRASAACAPPGMAGFTLRGPTRRCLPR